MCGGAFIIVFVCVGCVLGAAKLGDPSNPLTNQVTILATNQCTNTPTTLPHSWRGVGACWMYEKRKFALCWNQHVPAVFQTNGLNATGTTYENSTGTSVAKSPKPIHVVGATSSPQRQMYKHEATKVTCRRIHRAKT